jgi:hypothetical protein
MKMIAINEHGSKLKYLSVEMPNAPYSNRCAPFGKNLILLKRGGFS